MEQRGQELNSFKQLVKKTVDTKVSAAIKPRSYARETDQHCLQNSCTAATKANTHGQSIKNSKIEKSKLWELKALVFQCSNSNETSK